MSLNNAKHIVGEIDGIRCTIVESEVTLERAAFLTDLLRLNNLEVKELVVPSAAEGDEPKYTVGVTDLVFNPVFAVYERSLKNAEGEVVTPEYWKKGHGYSSES
jgi:hypothetical protein